MVRAGAVCAAFCCANTGTALALSGRRPVGDRLYLQCCYATVGLFAPIGDDDQKMGAAGMGEAACHAIVKKGDIAAMGCDDFLGDR
jgi:hypothetical protein